MHSPVLLVLLPLAGAGLALVGKLVPPRLAVVKQLFAVAAVLPLGGMTVVLARTLPEIHGGEILESTLGGWPEPYGITLRLDGFAWLSSALIVLISVMVIMAAFSRWASRGGAYGPVFFFFLMTLIAGMAMVTLTGDIFTMFVAFEIVAIAAYVLIAFDRTDEGLLASLKYLILSSVGILFFLIGVFLVYRDLGTLSLRLIAGHEALQSSTIRLAVVAMVVGIGVRTAFIPFHTWLPEAHAYAPHPISALLSGVLIKVSFFAMVRILRVFSAAYLQDLLLWIGGTTALVAVVWALSQHDAKRLLAYHSISQMGYVLAAFGAVSTLSMPAATLYAVNHALFKSLLFLSVGAFIRISGQRSVYQMRGLARTAPLLAGAFLVGALSIAGIPPFNGYAGKQFVSAAVAGSPVYVMLWATAVGTTASFIKLSRVLTRPSEGPSPERERMGPWIILPTWMLALASAATGVWARPLFGFYERMLAVTALTPQTAWNAPEGSGAENSSPAPAAVPEQLFTVDKLLDGALILGAGILLYLLISTGRGKRVTGRIGKTAPDITTVLVMFFLGLAVFSIFAVTA